MLPKGLPITALEGWVLILLAIAGSSWLYVIGGPLAAAPGAVLALLLIAKFHDPSRTAPGASLGVVSPVDGVVLAVETDQHDSCLDRRAVCIRLQVSLFGAYSLRTPIEGKVQQPGGGQRGLWLRTDEGQDVVVAPRRWWLWPPVARVRIGQRLGHGQRCGFVRLARQLEVWVPTEARLEVAAGARVRAGESILATLAGTGA